MPLLVQLRLDGLPNQGAAGGSGLLQLFYCTTDEPDLCERSLNSWSPFSDGATLRIVSAEGGTVSDVSPRFRARVSGREHKPVTVRPRWVVGSMAKKPCPHRIRHGGHAHRSPGVTTPRVLYGVDRQWLEAYRCRDDP